MSRPAPARWAVRLTWMLRLASSDLRRHRRARLLGTGAFALAVVAIGAAAGSWRSVREAERTQAADTAAELVAFLRSDVTAPARAALADALARLPGVAAVRQLASDEALARMRVDLGDRAAVLDGVEEGFLPATLEVSLRVGAEGVGRADAIAWRLRRMDGIADVDVLRAATDQRLARSALRDRRLGQLGWVLAGAAALAALVLAASAHHTRRADARLLSGFGFTAAGVVTPAALTGAACAAVGTALGLTLWWVLVQAPATVLAPGVGTGSGPLSLFVATDASAAGPGIGMAEASVALTLVAAVVIGAALGAWGARPVRRQGDDDVVFGG